VLRRGRKDLEFGAMQPKAGQEFVLIIRSNDNEEVCPLCRQEPNFVQKQNYLENGR
jgi:hypothetical protein